jgi:hypothetical protein
VIKGFCGRGLRNKIEAAQSVALPSRALSKACSLWRKPTRFLEYPELELSNSLPGNIASCGSGSKETGST